MDSVVYEFKGGYQENGEPHAYLSGVPARDITAEDLAVFGLDEARQGEMVASKLYAKAKPPKQQDTAPRGTDAAGSDPKAS